jgi:hypothetical protein
MTKNNSNWKTIEEEFIKEFDYLNNDYGADLQPILKFFKPYFQEKMHEISIQDLEGVDNQKG